MCEDWITRLKKIIPVYLNLEYYNILRYNILVCMPFKDRQYANY